MRAMVGETYSGALSQLAWSGLSWLLPRTSLPPLTSLFTGRATFRAEASCGPVECTSRGCRPVPGSEAAELFRSEPEGAEPLEHRGNGVDSLRHLARMADEACPPGDAGRPGGHAQGLSRRGRGSSFPAEFAEFVDELRCRSDRLGSHEEVADRYYQTAVLRRPFDVDVLIRYAEFAWQRKRNHMQAETLLGRPWRKSPRTCQRWPAMPSSSGRASRQRGGRQGPRGDSGRVDKGRGATQGE